GTCAPIQVPYSHLCQHCWVSCLVVSVHFLLPNSLQIPRQHVAAIQLAAEEVHQHCSVYLPLFPRTLSIEERQERVAVVSTPWHERVETSHQMEDRDFVSIYETMSARARANV
ncbi:unnamed protein product, partial [Sphacelaria rigidula]